MHSSVLDFKQNAIIKFEIKYHNIMKLIQRCYKLFASIICNLPKLFYQNFLLEKLQTGSCHRIEIRLWG